MSSFVVQNQVDILPLQDVKTLDKNLSLQKLQMKCCGPPKTAYFGGFGARPATNAVLDR